VDVQYIACYRSVYNVVFLNSSFIGENVYVLYFKKQCHNAVILRIFPKKLCVLSDKK
jgi:hypothetical protein